MAIETDLVLELKGGLNISLAYPVEECSASTPSLQLVTVLLISYSKVVGA